MPKVTFLPSSFLSFWLWLQCLCFVSLSSSDSSSLEEALSIKLEDRRNSIYLSKINQLESLAKEEIYKTLQDSDHEICISRTSMKWRSAPGKLVVNGEIKLDHILKTYYDDFDKSDSTGEVKRKEENIDTDNIKNLNHHYNEDNMQYVNDYKVIEGVTLLDEADLDINGDLHANGDKKSVDSPKVDITFKLKGVNWWGFENAGYMIGGLQKRTIDEILDFLVDHDFNGIRIPLAVKFCLTSFTNTWPDVTNLAPSNIKLASVTKWQILDEIVEKAADRGIFIMFDMHDINPESDLLYGERAPLWYDDEYNEEQVMLAWRRIMKRYGHMWNLFAVDLKNECRGPCSWGMGNNKTDVNSYYERQIRDMALSAPEYKGLFVCEGVQSNTNGKEPSPYPHWWGANLFGAAEYPIRMENDYLSPSGQDYKHGSKLGMDITIDNSFSDNVEPGQPTQKLSEAEILDLNYRVVYSPHIYGPSVFDLPIFNEENFPRNLEKVYNNQYGWFHEELKRAIIVGEWGGKCNDKDWIVQDRLSTWLEENCMTDAFWWALNPGSADTEGLLNDEWNNYSHRKMTFVNKLQPKPTKIRYNAFDDEICIKPGSTSNPRCDNNGWNAVSLSKMVNYIKDYQR